MTLTPQDLLIQEKILLAVHKCTIEEAKEKERSINWCIIGYDEKCWETYSIWLPPTLDRVLYALGNDYFQYMWMIFCFENDDDWEYKQQVCMRKLLNDDGTGATLRDQSQETKDKIAELLGV